MFLFLVIFHQKNPFDFVALFFFFFLLSRTLRGTSHGFFNTFFFGLVSFSAEELLVGSPLIFYYFHISVFLWGEWD